MPEGNITGEGFLWIKTLINNNWVLLSCTCVAQGDDGATAGNKEAEGNVEGEDDEMGEEGPCHSNHPWPRLLLQTGLNVLFDS